MNKQFSANSFTASDKAYYVIRNRHKTNCTELFFCIKPFYNNNDL